MPATIESLLDSIRGAPVLDPGDLAAAVVDGERSGRLGEVSEALSTKPAPTIPPRYESEIRTWLARTEVGQMPDEARIQAYAAVHLDPHNGEAIRALDAACEALGREVRTNTWKALSRSYPDVPSVRDAAEEAGVTPPDPAALRAARRRAPRRKPAGAGKQEGRAESGNGDRQRRKRHRVSGFGALLPVNEPDPVKADRLAVVHLALGNRWEPLHGRDAEHDPLSWAVRVLRGGKGGPLPAQASATQDFVALSTGRLEPGEDRGPHFGRLLRRLKSHPAVVVWATHRQLESGDIHGAQRAYERAGEIATPPYATALEELGAAMAIVNGDADAGWALWEAGDLPAPLRAPLARALLERERDADADEVLGLPEVAAALIGDPAVLELRFDLEFLDGNAEGAAEQAARLVEVAPDSRRAVGREWLALAFTGRTGDLGDRIPGDCDRLGTDVSTVVATVLPVLARRVARVTKRVTEQVTQVRADLQQLAKGKTIRSPEVFSEAAQGVAHRLEGLQTVGAVLSLAGERHAAADEGLVTFLAAGDGRSTHLADDEVIVSSPGPQIDDEAARRLTAPARELRERSGAFSELVTRSTELFESAVAEAGREDLNRRRLEERVSRRARRAADLLDVAVGLLDVEAPVPDVAALISDDPDSVGNDDSSNGGHAMTAGGDA